LGGKKQEAGVEGWRAKNKKRELKVGGKKQEMGLRVGDKKTRVV
jgi:hypothetical protein